MLPYSLNNFEIQKSYQNEPKFICVYSRDSLPVVKTCAAQMEHRYYILISTTKRTNWIAWFVNDNNVTNFDIFRVEYIPKKSKIIKDNKNITANIYMIQ